jgi:hypothetical protein
MLLCPLLRGLLEAVPASDEQPAVAQSKLAVQARPPASFQPLWAPPFAYVVGVVNLSHAASAQELLVGHLQTAYTPDALGECREA